MGGLYDNNRQRFKKNTVQSKCVWVCVCVCVCVCGDLKRRIGHVKWWSEGIRERSLWRSRRLLSAPNRLCIFSQSHVCNMQTTHTHTHTHTHTLWPTRIQHTKHSRHPFVPRGGTWRGIRPLFSLDPRREALNPRPSLSKYLRQARSAHSLHQNSRERGREGGKWLSRTFNFELALSVVVS